VKIRYDTIEVFNVDSKAECDQLNLAHVAEKNWNKQMTVPTYSSVQVIREGIVNAYDGMKKRASHAGKVMQRAIKLK